MSRSAVPRGKVMGGVLFLALFSLLARRIYLKLGRYDAKDLSMPISPVKN